MASVLDATNRIMREEAEALGISCTAFEGSDAVLLMERGDLRFYTRCSQTSLQSSVGRLIALDKMLTKQVLQRFGLPTAKGVSVEREDQLGRISALSLPLVMKPIHGKQGAGVVVGLSTYEEARQVFAHRTEKGPVLFEEMLQGREYRVVCVDFTFCAAAYRKPAFVLGDGRHTILELIAEKNRDPRRESGHTGSLTKIEIDELVLHCLAESNYHLDSIPAEGVEVRLRKTANLSTGGESHDVTDEVCAENRALFEQISRVCDLNVIGIDFMCGDISSPAVSQSGAGVIEVNASPGLRMHHSPMSGKPRNVAWQILQMVLSKLGNSTR
jgi:cyanophycin synthetase